MAFPSKRRTGRHCIRSACLFLWIFSVKALSASRIILLSISHFCPSPAGSEYTTAQEIGTHYQKFCCLCRLSMKNKENAKNFFAAILSALFFSRERPIEIAGSCAAVDQEGGAGNKRSFITHQKLRHICNFVCGPRAPCGTIRKHVLVEITTRPVELVKRQRSRQFPGRWR